jgi:hypothetical protein
MRISNFSLMTCSSVLPDPVELTPGWQRQLWHAAGAGAACTGVLCSGLAWGWKLGILLVLVPAALAWERRRPRPRRLWPEDDPWRVLFTNGVERSARPGTTLGLWPGAVTLRCGARRLIVFADECSTADFRRLKRRIRMG